MLWFATESNTLLLDAMLFERLTPQVTLVLALLILHLAPIWIFTYLSTQDGSSYVYNPYVLKEFINTKTTVCVKFISWIYCRFPTGLLTPLWQRLCTLYHQSSAKRLSSAWVIALLPLAVFCFLYGIDRERVHFGLALIGFIYTYYRSLLHMGSYNFALSIPMFFVTLIYWWRHKMDLTLPRLALLYPLLILTFFCHFHFLQLVVVISCFAVYSHLYRSAVDTYGQDSSSTLDNFSVICLRWCNLSPDAPNLFHHVFLLFLQYGRIWARLLVVWETSSVFHRHEIIGVL